MAASASIDRAPAPRTVAALILVVTIATIGGALASQYVFGLVPCKLCLWQRWPYYAGVPLAFATLLVPVEWLRRAGLACLALLFAGSTALAAYHSGAEWGLWPGPSDCGGGAAGPASAGDLLRSLETITIADCTQAAWRFLGVSLAGWNALVSLLVAGLAGAAAVRAGTHGSSSVSQYR